jgi:hypothetical protein
MHVRSCKRFGIVIEARFAEPFTGSDYGVMIRYLGVRRI